MNDRYGAQWSSALPWVLLGRRTQYHPDLGTSPAEMLYGQMPRLPGDLLENNGQDLTSLLHHVRTYASRPPIQTSHHRRITPFFPESAKSATHVYTRIGNPTQLGPIYRGPYEVVERIGKSCLKVRVGNWANGNAQHELAHWNNCFPKFVPSEPVEKPRRGRKLNANAVPFVPAPSNNG